MSCYYLIISTYQIIFNHIIFPIYTFVNIPIVLVSRIIIISNHYFSHISPQQIPTIPYKSSLSATSPYNPFSKITHQKKFKFPYKIKIFSKSPQIPAKLTLLDYACRHFNQQKSLKIKAFSSIQSLSHRTHKLFHELAIQ